MEFSNEYEEIEDETKKGRPFLNFLKYTAIGVTSTYLSKYLFNS